MDKKEVVVEIIVLIFLSFVTIWGCVCMVHGMRTENVCETVVGCTFWLYGLITLKLRSIEKDVEAITALTALIGLRAVCTSAAEHKESENGYIE